MNSLPFQNTPITAPTNSLLIRVLVRDESSECLTEKTLTNRLFRSSRNKNGDSNTQERAKRGSHCHSRPEAGTEGSSSVRSTCYRWCQAFQNPVQKREGGGEEVPCSLSLLPTFPQVLPTGQFQWEARKTESIGTTLLGHRTGWEKQRVKKNQHVTLAINNKSIWILQALFKIGSPSPSEEPLSHLWPSIQLISSYVFIWKKLAFHPLLGCRPPLLSLPLIIMVLYNGPPLQVCSFYSKEISVT